MNLARIFISYTSRDEISKQMSELLFNELNNAGFAAWRDQERLEHGEKWHDKLTLNLVGSHAGVVLLSPAALNSEWVLKEATYLKVRSDGSRDFKVVAVLLDGLTPDTINSDDNFKTLRFSDDQMVFLSKTKICRAVIKALNEVKLLWSSTRPEDRLIEDIMIMLKSQTKCDDRALLRLADDLDLKLDDWFPDGSLKNSLTRELARLMATKPPHLVAKAIGTKIISLIEPTEARKLIQHIMPFRINGHGAQRLAEIAGQAPPGAAAGLNATDPKIAILYLRRASGSLAGWHRVQINAVYDPEGGGTDLVAEVRKAIMIKRHMTTEAELDNYLADLKDPYFVIVPSQIDGTVLLKLRQALGNLCFFVLTADLHPECPLCESEGLVFLAPPLAGEAEKNILDGYNDALMDLEQYFAARDEF